MNRFDEGKVRRIDLGDGDWVEMLAVLTYEKLVKINFEKDAGISTLNEVLVEWNLKNSKGEDVPISVEMLKKMDFRTRTLINDEINKLFSLPKAQTPTSGEK